MTGSRGRHLMLAGSAAICAVATPAYAQLHHFDVPAQPTETAIVSIARQANIQIIAPRRITAGKRGNIVRGDMTVEAALDRLLSGTGLAARRTGPDTFTLVSSSASRARMTAANLSAADATAQGSGTAKSQSRPSVRTPGPAPQEPATSIDIVVTGSRLPSGFAMPVPVSVVSAEELQQTAPTGLDQALTQIPALAGSTIAQNSGRTSTASGTNGQSLLDLRGLGPQRTLVMLDGARLGVTNTVNSVDINIIPQSLIQRVEVVTGGASASYGSDAVAGVVNFVLDTRFEGIKADLSAGITSRGDAGNQRASLAFGKALGDSTRVIGSVDYYRMDGIGYGKNGRGWYDNVVGVYPNPDGDALPSTIVRPNVRSSLANYGGTISAISGCPADASGDACRALVGQQFVEGGALAPFDPGTDPGARFASGGDGAIVTNGLAPDVDRTALFLHLEQDLGTELTLWGQGVYSHSYTSNPGQTTTQTRGTAFRIYEGNAFLPAEVADILAATPGTQNFRVQRYSLDLGEIDVRGITTVKRFAGGLKGGLGGSWNFDSTVAYQDSLYKLDARNALQRNLYAAADAVVDPDSGAIMCASQLAGYDPDCQPFDIFGPDAASPEAVDYIMRYNKGHTRLKQWTADLNLRGDLMGLDLGAGNVSAAVGASYRHLSARRTVDEYSDIYLDFTGIRGYPTSLDGRYGGYQYYNPSPLAGKVEVAEGYAELGIPLLSGKPMFEDLDLTLAGRLTHYSQSGWEAMWKTGLNWTVNDSLRLRGTISADTRAPSVLELFSTASVSRGNSVAPWSGADTLIATDGLNISTGNPDLDPEKARTYTAGVVFTPTFAPGFKASLDFYKIDLKDSILTLSYQAIVDNCYAGMQEFCDSITVNGNPITTTEGITGTDFVAVTSRYINYAVETTSGLDFEASYAGALGNGELDLRFSANYLLEAEVANTCGKKDMVGSLGNCADNVFPRLRGRLSASYGTGPLKLYVQERFVSSGKKNPAFVEGINIDKNDVPATFYTDLNLTVDVGELVGTGGNGEIYFNVQNLFDQDPRPTLQRSRSWIEPTDFGIYDSLGRRFLLGFRYRL